MSNIGIGPEGRGSALHPGNRFESTVRADFEEPPEPPTRTEFFADRSRSILTRNSSPDLKFALSLNPYRGCEHGCSYCANPSHRIPVLGTDSVLSTASVLGTKNEHTAKPVLGTDPVATTRLNAGTELDHTSDLGPRFDEEKKSSEGTKPELGTEGELGYQSVPSTEAEPSHQVGAIPKSRRSTRVTSGSTRRVQPYIVSDTDNFTRVPHAVTEALQREEFSSRQFRILITILRETIGWGREYAELSAKDFAKKTGIAASDIFITLRDLEDTCAIIRRVNGRNAKNSYALNKGFFAKYPTKRGPEGGPSTGTNSALDTEAVLTTNSVSKLSSNPVRSTHYQSGAIKSEASYLNYDAISIGKKDPKKLKNSLHELPEILRPLIETIRPAAKLESEKECAFELLAEYSAEDLADAVIYLQKNGVLGSGLQVHSPFKYLMSAAEQVLAQVSKIRARSSTLTTQAPQNESAQAYEVAVPLFEKELPDEVKQQYIAKYIESELPHGFLPPQGILRKLVPL